MKYFIVVDVENDCEYTMSVTQVGVFTSPQDAETCKKSTVQQYHAEYSKRNAYIENFVKSIETPPTSSGILWLKFLDNFPFWSDLVYIGPDNFVERLIAYLQNNTDVQLPNYNPPPLPRWPNLHIVECEI